MTVHCPHCSVGYLLPDHLLGPRGARVRCPKCGQSFVVMREESIEPVEPTASEPSAVPAPPPADPQTHPPALEESPAEVATRLLEALAARLGGGLEDARRSGRVLADLGPDLMRVWDQYRDALGARADAATFRDALRERWQVDLGAPPPREPGIERETSD